MDTWGDATRSMARACLAGASLVRSGKWTLDEYEAWLKAVITDDAAYVLTMAEKIAKQ